MRDLETPWDGCPKCGEWVRFGFLSQTCPCGWSLEGEHADGRPVLPLLQSSFRLAGQLIVFVGSFAFAADVLGHVSVPEIVWLLGGAAILSSMIGHYLTHRARAATIGGEPRGE